MTKQPKYLNRIKRRWPRPINSRVKLAQIDFAFTMAVDKAYASEGTPLTGELQESLEAIGDEAACTLQKCKVPMSEWEGIRDA